MKTKLANRTGTRKWMFSLVILSMALAIGSPSVAQNQTTEQVLLSFVESYKTDAMALSANFGIRVGEDWWTVNVIRKQDPYLVGKNKQYTFHNYGPHEVTMTTGKPPLPTWYFRIDSREVLDKINEQVWTASTAASKSTPSDKVSFDIEDMEGFTSNQKHTATAYLAMEHFWKKDIVEVTHFSRDGSLPSHGASIVSLYTMKDKRIAWFSIGKDEAANDQQNLERSQIPNLFIITKGHGKVITDTEEIELKAGMSVFIGPYVKHVISNTGDEPLEGILVLYGDNIDYAKGQSYIDFLESEYAFYETNEKGTALK